MIIDTHVHIYDLSLGDYAWPPKDSEYHYTFTVKTDRGGRPGALRLRGHRLFRRIRVEQPAGQLEIHRPVEGRHCRPSRTHLCHPAFRRLPVRRPAGTAGIPRFLSRYGRAAQHVCKATGFFTLCRATPKVMDPAFYSEAYLAMYNAFGPERCMYSSDWPVACAPYENCVSLTRELTGDGADHVLFETAKRVYRIESL